MGENFFGITDKGRLRDNNEDRFIVKTVFNDQFIVAAVIDGVGGYEGGEVAAQITADTITKALNKLPVNIIRKLADTLDAANEKIIKEKQVNTRNDKMACVVTLALVDIEKNILYFAHVGDTRLYLFRDGSLIKITKDHSTVGFLEESGRLSEDAAMSHPRRNEVNKALGFETGIGARADFVDTGESPFLPGDTILVCSDGLTDMINADKIISILNQQGSLAQKAGGLINAANDAGGRDNITVVLVKNHKSPRRQEVTRPVATPMKTGTNVDGPAKPVIVQDPASPQTGKPARPRANRGLVLLCVLLLAGIAWLLLRQKNPTGPLKTATGADTLRPVNHQQLMLVDSIHAATGKAVQVNSTQPFLVSDTITITRDSLHLMGNGVTFIRDVAYNGPAIMLAASCKYILLDSMTLENFDVGVLVQNKGLHLKNVHFTNCTVPLQFNQQLMGNAPVTGAQADKLFVQLDTAKASAGAPEHKPGKH